MKIIIICMCLLAFVNFAVGKEKDYAKSLSERLTELHKQMADKSVEVKKKALQDILPTKADFKILFPEDADMLWEKIESHYKNMIQHIDEVAKELTRRKWAEIQAVDVRKNDIFKRYEAVLKLIPKDIPVFRVIKRSKQGSAGSSSYLFINGRWIHLQGLEIIPKIISRKEKIK